MRGWMAVVLCLLLALFAAPAAAEPAPEGESYAERLAAARLRYNEETVHIFRSGIGGRQNGKINVRMYLSKDREYFVAQILDSTQITDEAEMEAVLETVARHRDFRGDVYGPVAGLKAQWIAHNIIYAMATGSEEEQRLIELLVGEDLSGIASRARELDLTPPDRLTARESLLYSLIRILYGTDRK